MSIKKIFAAFAAAAVMMIPAASVSVSSAEALPAKAFISGQIGSTTVSSADKATPGSIVADIDGDAQYQAEWVVNDGGASSLTFLALSIPNVTRDSYPNIAVNITEVYIDGVKQNYIMSSNAVNTAKYEAGKDPETRVYLYDGIDGTNVADLPQTTAITKSIKVIFSVTGTGKYGTSNIQSNLIMPAETTTTTASPLIEYITAPTKTSVSIVPSSTTGDGGVAAVAITGLAVTAGIGVLSKVKFKKKK